MKKASQVSEIDRLIDLASDERPQGSPETIDGHSIHALSLEDKKDPQPSMWRVLLQLRVLLPYLSRLLPLIEGGLLGTGISRASASVDTSHFDQGVAAIESAHRDLTAQLKNQTSEIKYLQEQVTWLSKALEAETKRQEETLEKVASLSKLAKILGIVITVLLLGLIGAVVFLIVTRPS